MTYRKGKEDELMSEIPSCEYYLYVESQGKILAKKSKRVDLPNYETWRCECLGRFFRVTKLYPFEAATRTIQIDDALCESLKIKFEEHARKKPNSARHEAGHAVLFYALRLFRVALIDIRPNVMLKGNLHEQLKAGWASSIGFVGGSTSPATSVESEPHGDTRIDLGGACQGYGGLAACRGDNTGVDGDLAKIKFIIQAVVASAQPLVASDSMSHVQQQMLDKVCDRLKGLAFEIIADPIVAARHKELAKQLWQGSGCIKSRWRQSSTQRRCRTFPIVRKRSKENFTCLRTIEIRSRLGVVPRAVESPSEQQSDLGSIV